MPPLHLQTCKCITTMTFLGVNCAALILFLLLLVTQLLRLVTCAAACENLKRLQLVLLRRAHCPLIIMKLDLTHVLVILKCLIC